MASSCTPATRRTEKSRRRLGNLRRNDHHGRSIAMRARNIVVGQRVNQDKVELAKSFRRSMTVPERLLWQRLRRNQLKGLHFRRQQVIDGFVADYYCHAAGVVVEVDGPVHQERKEYDAARDTIFRQRGIRIL